ncbi:MAG: hypothetical protein ABI352_05880 [Candidatus Dormibacter sp.]
MDMQPPPPGSAPPLPPPQFALQPQPPPQYAPAQYAPAAYAQPAPGNGIGTAGGVVGIVGLCLFWIPYVGIIMGIIAVSLGGVGLSRANRLGGASKGMSITGIVCGAIALIVNLIWVIAIINAAHQLTGA